MKKTLVTAHAGCLNQPLDSLAYIKEALNYDIDVVELDVRFTTQNQAVLSHDEIENHDSLVSVKEALRVIQTKENVRVNYDLKNTTSISNLIEDIKSTKMEGRGLITGCQVSLADRLALKSVGIHCFTNVETDFAQLFDKTYCEALAKQLTDEEIEGININYRYVTKELIEALHHASKGVYVWTVDELVAAKKLIELGVDSITTNLVADVCQLVHEKEQQDV